LRTKYFPIWADEPGIDDGNSYNHWHYCFDDNDPDESTYHNGDSLASHLVQYDVVIIKVCFAFGAGISGDGTLADTATAVGRKSLTKLVLKWHIRGILQRMAEHPENFFVMLTQYPYAPDLISDVAARRDSQFAKWMTDTLAVGLDSYGAFPSNVKIFNIFNYICDNVGQASLNWICSSLDGHPNAAQINMITPILSEFIWDNALTYEQSLIGKHLAENYPKPARAAWQFTCDWEAARGYRLVIQNELDTATLRRARVLNDSVYWMWTGADWNIGGVYRWIDAGGTWHTDLPASYRLRAANGDSIYAGYIGAYANISDSCNIISSKKFWQFNADSLFWKMQRRNRWGTYFDGMMSNGTHSTPGNIPASGPDMDENSVDDRTQFSDPYVAGKLWHNGYNLALKRFRDTANAQLGYSPHYFSWTVSSYNRASGSIYEEDTLAITYTNGQWWENARGDNGSNNAIGASNNFQEWIDISDAWINNATQDVPMLGITTILDRGGGTGKDDADYARWWIAWTALTSSYIAFHTTDGIEGANHNDAVWFEEFEKNLGAYTSARQLVSGKLQVYVRFFQNGAIIFNDNKSTTPQTITEVDLLSLTMVDTPYYRYWGNIDTVNNNGSRFSSVTMTPVNLGTYWMCDPIFLSTTVDTVVADVIIDNTSGATSPGGTAATMNGFNWDAGADGTSGFAVGQSAQQLNPTYTNAAHFGINQAWEVIWYRQHYALADATLRTATYTPTLNREGWWILYEWHGWYGATDALYAEATNAQCLVQHARGDTTVYINQTINRGQWNMIDTFYYAPTQNKSLILSNTGANGYVVADAFRWKLVTSESEAEPPPPPPPPPARNYRRRVPLKPN